MHRGEDRVGIFDAIGVAAWLAGGAAVVMLHP